MKNTEQTSGEANGQSSFHPNAQGVVLPPPCTSFPPAKKKNTRLLWASIIILMWIIVGSVIFLVMRFLDNDKANVASLYSEPPSAVANVMLPETGVTPTFRNFSFNSRGFIPFEDTRIIPVRNNGRNGLMALSAVASSTEPLWNIELDSDPSQCSLKNSTLICGNVSIDIPTGTQTMTPLGSVNKTPPVVEPEPIKSKTVEIPTPTQDSTSSEEQDGRQREALPPNMSSGDTNEVNGTTVDAPFSVDEDGTVRTSSGASIRHLHVDEDGVVFATAPPTASTSKDDALWILTDGTVVVCVQGEEVLWSKDLPATSKGINHFFTGEDPRWQVSDSILLIGAPDGVLGIDVHSGKEQWRTASRNLGDWYVNGSELYTVSSDTLSVFNFPAREALTTENLPTEPPVDLSQISDASLVVPQSCASFSGYENPGEPAPVQFTQGRAAEESSVNNAALSIKETAHAQFGARQQALVLFDCYGGGSGIINEIGIYSVDLSYIGSFNFDEDNHGADLRTSRTDVLIENIKAEGNKLTFDVPALDLYGDEGCHGCAKSGSATMTYTWKENDFVLEEAKYHTPSGTVQIPEISDVQQVIDLFAEGKDEETLPYLNDNDVIDEVRQKVGEHADIPIRDSYFPSRVENCSLISTVDKYEANFAGKKGPLGTADVEKGDIICGLTPLPGNTLAKVEGNSRSSGDFYAVTVLLAGTEDGSVKIKHFVRSFS